MLYSICTHYTIVTQHMRSKSLTWSRIRHNGNDSKLYKDVPYTYQITILEYIKHSVSKSGSVYAVCSCS